MASNLSDSYEKVVLVVALLVALGLGYLAYSKMGKIEEAFVPPVPGNKPAPQLPGKSKMDRAAKQLVTKVDFQPATVGGRKVDTFIGIPWFLQKDESTVDLGEPSEAAVHEGIPNQWWLDNGINPGFADSPEQDADNDGFTNREEYDGKTDPALASSHPPLINKLVVRQLINDKFSLDFSGDIGERYKFKMRTRVGGITREQALKDFIPAGQDQASVFFATPPGQFRFRLKEVVEEEIEKPGTGLRIREKFGIVEDLKPNLQAMGTTYKVPYSGRFVVFNDYKAVLALEAVGEGDKEFEVPLNTTFSLPHDGAANAKPFLFKEVTKAGDVLIEWEEGGEKKFVALQVPAPPAP